MKNERRRYDRHRWLHFESRVRVKRSLFKKEWIPVVPYDYSRYGLGIQTDETFDIDDTVCLFLELTNHDGMICIPEIQGIIRYKEKHHSRFNYGVEFLFESKSEQLVLEDLVRIEQALRHFDAVTIVAKSTSMARRG